MNKKFDIEYIVSDLVKRHKCHTIIMYGSYADNTNTPESDIDILCLNNGNRVVQDARYIDEFYLDAWVYPEKNIMITRDFIHVKDAKVLLEKDKIGTNLIKRVQDLYNSGVDNKITKDKVEGYRLWAEKMINRSKKGDIEGNYRRHWLANDLLEIYFEIRNIWFLGSKRSFKYLIDNDIKAYQLFDELYSSNNDIKILKELSEYVFKI